MARVEWDEGCRSLLRAAREISAGLGHHEIVCPLHLLPALLVHARPLPLAVAERGGPAVKGAVAESAPPWGDEVVLSPGGQTPTTKQVLLKAIELAGDSGDPVSVEHAWSALRECEAELVGAVLCGPELPGPTGAGGSGTRG
jgi:hypothetical protein